MLRACLALLAFFALYGLCAWIGGLIPVNSAWKPAPKGVEIAIWSNGVHTDLILPQKHPEMDWDRFAPLEKPDPASRYAAYVMLGWGDRGFFLEVPTWDEFSVGVAAKAMFWPSATAMHLQRIGWLPAASADCVRLVLRPEEYRRMVAFLKQGFALREGRPQLIKGAAYGKDDVFYEGAGSYQLFYTCNNWVNQALKAAGVRAALWSPFAGGVLAPHRSKAP